MAPTDEQDKGSLNSCDVNGTNDVIANGTNDVAFTNGHTNHAFVITDPQTETQTGNHDINGSKSVDQDNFPEPLWLCAFICKRPKTCFGVTLSLHLLMLLVTAVLIRVGYDIIPFSLDQLPLFLNDHPDYQRGMAWKHRDMDADIIDFTNFDNSPIPERSKVNYPIQLYFDAGSKNVFTKDNLQHMKRAEDALFNDTFKADFCYQIKNPITNSYQCAKPASILRFFDGTYAFTNSTFNDPNFDNVVGVLNRANSIPRMKAQLKGFLGLDAIINSTTATSTITRMSIMIGGPLAGYRNLTDREQEQNEKIKEHVVNKMKPLFDDWYIGLGPEIVVYPFAMDIVSSYIQGQAFKDMSLALGSLLFIYLFLSFQTRSQWISGLGTLSIVTSFTWANIVYRVVVDYRFFGTFHILSIFIILGIGADDFFVFLDTWKLSAFVKYPSLAHRLSAVYRKAGMAMLFTSLTTAVAFSISGSSPLLAISSFGIFSALLVLVNYMSVITFFPCVVITYHLYWSGNCCRGGCCGRPPIAPDAAPTSMKKNLVVRFFSGPYYRFIQNPVCKVLCIVVSLAMLGFFGYHAAQLKPNDEETEFLPESTSLGKYLKASTTRFMPSDVDRNLGVYIVWGLHGQDRSSCHKTDYKCKGRTSWDDSFNMNSKLAQEEMMAFCNKLKTGLTPEEIENLKIRRSEVTGQYEVACFIDELNDYLKIEETEARYGGRSLSLPALKTEMKSGLMDNNPDIYLNNTPSSTSNFAKWFEIGLQYWIMSGFNYSTFLTSPQYKRYEPLLGSSLHTENYLVQRFPFNVSDVRYGTRLRYAAVMVNTTLLIRKLSYMEGLPVRDSWEKFVVAEVGNMSASLRGGFMTSTGSFTGTVWHWLQVQRTLVTSAVSGIVISICVAFPILLLATMNILVALYATITIGVITMSVIGTIPLAGWSLGTLESLNLVLVVGLAVDYVVHLAEGYSRSLKPDRKGRLHDMLEEVGISVLSGAVTTLGSSLFLFMAVIVFFKQFGAFMFATIGFSIFYSLVLFVATLSIIGPQNEFCSIKPLWRKIKSCFD